MPGLPHATDLELLGLIVAEDGQSGRFELGSGLVRHDGALYGGTGLAVSVVAMEAATQRDVLWCSTQFVSQPYMGETVEWQVERLAVGKRAAQLQVRATYGDQTVFVAIGSTGIASADGLTGQYVDMPAVAGPEESSPRQWSRADRRGDQTAQGRPSAAPHEPDNQFAQLPDEVAAEPGPDSWTRHIDMREGELFGEGGATVAFWAKRRDDGPLTPAMLSFIADMVPVAIARAAGKMGAGSSLDNSMRFHGGDPETEWVLIELLGELAHGGYGHGSLRVWTEEGKLIATGSQTAAMRHLFNEGEAPNRPQPQPRPASGG